MAASENDFRPSYGFPGTSTYIKRLLGSYIYSELIAFHREVSVRHNYSH
jgi:hypothetical protein